VWWSFKQHEPLIGWFFRSSTRWPDSVYWQTESHNERLWNGRFQGEKRTLGEMLTLAECRDDCRFGRVVDRSHRQESVWLQLAS
jgi:hypothetical protein